MSQLFEFSRPNTPKIVFSMFKTQFYCENLYLWRENSNIDAKFHNYNRLFAQKIQISRPETFCQRAIFELKYVFSHHCVDLPPESPKQALALAFLAQIMALTMEVKPYSSLLSFHNA